MSDPAPMTEEVDAQTPRDYLMTTDMVHFVADGVAVHSIANEMFVLFQRMADLTDAQLVQLVEAELQNRIKVWEASPVSLAYSAVSSELTTLL